MASDPLSASEKPEPAPDIERVIELPWSQPKTDQEDVRAPDLLREIMEHPNYLEADADLGFLNRDDMRGTRLQ
ncbi:MAG: cytochrome D ubiquinol oxidase subunit II, partial [Sphingomonadales bacterium]|nr:cytochrome D ubiquinol oxidase subunit II [Sphingomonadales bacterium]